MTRRLARIATVACLVAATGLGAPAGSDGKVLVGIGEQNASDVFPSQLFKELQLKRARVVVAWNVALRRGDRTYLDNWLSLAREAGVEPLVHFGYASGSRCPRRPCKLPTVAEFTRAFRAFRRRWPSVRLLGAWNEANHITQPTFKNPKRAAQLFNVVRRYCRGCTIVAADVIDEGANMATWLKTFKRYARGERLWGLHNYLDTNYTSRRKRGGTRRLLRLVRGPVWLTETGGVVKFVRRDGATQLRYSESRANAAVKRMFELARRYRSRIKRLYVYNWRAPIRRARFDSGLLKRNFTPRPGWYTVRRYLKTRYFGP